MSWENLINEVFVKNSNLEQIDYFVKACNSVCKIFIKKENESGSGFFLEAIKGNQPFYCLVTCEHVLRNSYIEEKKKIKVYYDNHNKTLDLQLDKKERFIRQYTYMDIDATVVEIKPSDNVEKKYFLSFNPDYVKEENFNSLENKNIFIIQYPLAGPLKKSEGKILSIDHYQKNFSYNASTDKGSSGSPIFLENTSLVIGLHRRGFLNKERIREKNYGNFIGPIIRSLMDDASFISLESENNLIFEGEAQEKEDFLELFGKHFLNEGIYFFGKKIGQINMEIKVEEEEKKKKGVNSEIIICNNNFKSFGDGVIYKNNKVFYKGGFAFGKKEGTGTIYFDNGNYYIGEFRNDEIEGKGIIYNKDKQLIYEGEFVKGKKCGYGTLRKSEFYYSGQFKDDLFHGKGNLQFNSGLNYEGDFVNNLPEGEGKCTYKNGNFYIGKFLNGSRHGEGIYFSGDGSIIYEGTFVDDKYEGEGKLYVKDGNYYDGDFKNGEKSGHGELYNKNGEIIFEGQFCNNEPKGSFKIFKGNDYSIREI